MSERNLPLPGPIACTLTQAEFATRRSELLPGLLSRADSQEAVPGGFRWSFREINGLPNDVASVIEAERRCCQFLRFRLTFEPNGGPLWLEVSGTRRYTRIPTVNADQSSAARSHKRLNR